MSEDRNRIYTENKCQKVLSAQMCRLSTVCHTGLLVLQNAQPLFCTNTLDRRIYRAELDEILHGTLKGYISSNYRGIFRYSVWGPRYGVPREAHLCQQEWVQKALIRSYSGARLK